MTSIKKIRVGILMGLLLTSHIFAIDFAKVGMFGVAFVVNPQAYRCS